MSTPLRRTTILGLSGLLSLAAVGAAQGTRVISRTAAIVGNEQARSPALSADGRWTAFESYEDDLVPGDTNGERDVFLYDRIAGTTERLSESAVGVQGNDDSSSPSISASGQLVTFMSDATNLSPFDANGTTTDVFLLDRSTGSVKLISRSTAGAQGNLDSHAARISGDGTRVAFTSNAANLVSGDTNGLRDVYLRDTVAKTTERVSLSVTGAEPNGDCWQFDLSGDGLLVVFETDASNLVIGDTNGERDLFLRVVPQGFLFRVSVTPAGAEADGWCEDPSLSADGRWLAFVSNATNMVPGDTNGNVDVFVKDLQTDAVTIASVSSSGQQGTGWSSSPAISPDGRFVAFYSSSPELLPVAFTGFGIFVHDLQTGTTELVSVATDGTPANQNSYDSAISADGRFVSFESLATNLDPADTDITMDVYLRDRVGGPSRYCTGKVASNGCQPMITWNGLPSASGGTFGIGAKRILKQKTGLLFYGVQGPANLPFLGGTLCMSPALSRTPIQGSGGLFNLPCVGNFSFDFGALIASGADPSLVDGQAVYAQYWFRDPAHSDGTGVGLTDAVHFEIDP